MPYFMIYQTDTDAHVLVCPDKKALLEDLNLDDEAAFLTELPELSNIAEWGSAIIIKGEIVAPKKVPKAGYIIDID